MMKCILSLHQFLLACGMSVVMAGCQHEPSVAETDSDEAVSFYQGADISWVTEMEHNGHRFRTADGREQELLSLLKSYHLQAVRLRVWVDPSAHGNWCNSEDVVRKALRARSQQMDIMIDFHYSDWWADPGKQNIPEAWKKDDYEQMKKNVAQHTQQVLSLLKKNGVEPKWVQVGNETSNGFLWPMGQTDLHPEQYAGLFKAGYLASKKVFPEAKVIVHLDNGPKLSLYHWNLDILKQYGAQWDVIGMSVYPYWSTQNGEFSSVDEVIEKSVENIGKLHAKYGCDVMVVETGMECADENGRLADDVQLRESKRQLTKLLTLCKEKTHGHCLGVFYWEPECKPGTYRLGAFTDDGRPTLIMDAFRENGQSNR